MPTSQLLASLDGFSKRDLKRGRTSITGNAVDLSSGATPFQSPNTGRRAGVLGPGQDVTVRGLNDFIGAARKTERNLQGLEGIADQRGLSEALSSAGERADVSFDTAEGAVDRRQRGLGLSQSLRSQRSQSRRFNLGRAVATADAKGGVRRGFRDRAEEAQRQGADFEQDLLNIEQNARIGLSEAAGAKKIAKEQRKAAKKASTAGLIGSAVGFASAFSSEDYKHDKRPVAAEDGPLLDRLRKVRVEKWKYVGDDTDHIGPYAEEFNDTFNVGKDNKQMINLADAIGVLMGSVQELDAKVSSHG